MSTPDQKVEVYFSLERITGRLCISFLILELKKRLLDAMENGNFVVPVRVFDTWVNQAEGDTHNYLEALLEEKWEGRDASSSS